MTLLKGVSAGHMDCIFGNTISKFTPLPTMEGQSPTMPWLRCNKQNKKLALTGGFDYRFHLEPCYLEFIQKYVPPLLVHFIWFSSSGLFIFTLASLSPQILERRFPCKDKVWDKCTCNTHTHSAYIKLVALIDSKNKWLVTQEAPVRQGGTAWHTQGERNATVWVTKLSQGFQSPFLLYT